MPLPIVEPMRDLENALAAYERVRAVIEAQDLADLAPMNVDIQSVAFIALGVAPRIFDLRERAAALPEFDIKNIDNLSDYAKAAWYLYITNLPKPTPAQGTSLVEEVMALRAKLLLWAYPLAASGVFAPEAIDKIKEGAGHKDAASDVVALVALYVSAWDQAKGMCGITEQDLARGADIGPALFAMLARRDNEAPTLQQGTARVRQAWTVLDRAYQQCQRAVAFLRFNDGDADTYAPSLRRNAGPRAAQRKGADDDAASSTTTTAAPTSADAPAPWANLGTPATTGVAPGLGGDTGPFGN